MKKLSYLLLLSLYFVFACSDGINESLEEDEDDSAIDGDRDTSPGEEDGNPRNVYFYSIGLKDETNIRQAQEWAYDNLKVTYHPQMQILGNHLYATTITGIYRKSLVTLDDSNWELYGFSGMPINQFIKKGNIVLAITPGGDKNAFLLSEDNGKTYQDVTPAEFYVEGWEYKVWPSAITQNPKNPNSLLALVLPVGVAKSTDFGKTWNVLLGEIGGYQNWFVGFNPNDTTNIYNTGEHMIFESFIYSSYDNGVNWELIESMRHNCAHHIAFHPTNENEMIYAGEFIVKKSVNKGKEWKKVLNDEIYFYKSVYDKKDPKVVYSSGCTRIPDEEHKYTMYKSVDGGENWEILYQANLLGEGGVIDFELYEDKLFLYTYEDGICVLGLEEVPDKIN